MRKKIIKLVNVKSIVTLILTIVFAYLSITKVIDEQQFMNVFTIVIAFYFGTQSMKQPDGVNEQ